jgi:hypothetical protein
MSDLIKERPVRFCVIRGREIESVYDRPDAAVSLSDTYLRCDIIPEDQRSDSVASSLVKVVNVKVQSTGYYKACGFPFLLPVGPAETAQAVRKRLQMILGETDAGMSHIRLVGDKRYNKFEQEKVLKGEQIVREHLEDRHYGTSTLLLVRSSDSSVGRPGGSSSIKIYN